MSAYYDEVKANLSWYQLKSEFKDPMYQYMLKMERELYRTFIAPLANTNYSLLDDFVVNYKPNLTLQYGSYQCSVPGKEAFLDSSFSCFLFQLPFFLEQIQLGYIGFAFVIPILAISIFGGIKESYRWFILNQAIWDAFLCYDYICAKPTLLTWATPSVYNKQNTCFYRNSSETGQVLYIIFQGFRVFLRNASFIPVFHLAFSRFLCIYFPRYYKNFTKNGYKICIFIILFYVICIIIFTASPTSLIISAYLTEAATNINKCDIYCPVVNNPLNCMQNFPKYFQCQNGMHLDFDAAHINQQRVAKILKYISYSIPPIMFLLSIICAGFLIWKIVSQLKFQLKTNPNSFKQTIKISSVVGFQCLTMSVIFVITVIQKYMQIKAEALGTLKIFDDLPVWLLLLQYYTTTASLNIIRVILDSCIILTVLSGYSSCVISTFKLLFLCLMNPKKALSKVKYSLKGSEVTVISNSRKQ